jgi:hypothetical protein
MERGGIGAPGIQRGLATGEPGEIIMRLTVEDVARIAAQEASGARGSRTT